jgi:selenium-binding protein 1
MELRFGSLVTTALLALSCGNAAAETCISPYVKSLKQQEKVMYVWAIPAASVGGDDYLAVVDVNPASMTYGQVLSKVGVGGSNDGAHHIGFSDDRTKIWAAGLVSNRVFIFDVSQDATKPKLIRTISNIVELSGMTGPHTPYAIPGRILISMASGPDGKGPGGLAEFTNDGEFIAAHKTPNSVYETVVKPEFNRMISGSWAPQTTYVQTPDKWDPKTFSDTLLVWDLKERKILQELKVDPFSINVRWMLKPGAKYGYTNSPVANSLWKVEMRDDGQFAARKAAETGACTPADMRQSPDDKYLYVSCITGGEIQAWDITQPDNIKLHDTIQGVVQPNMMHVTGDGKRMYFTNSGAVNFDFSGRYALQLVHIGRDGRLKLDPFFNIDFSKPPYGPALPHDMLLN